MITTERAVGHAHQQAIVRRSGALQRPLVGAEFALGSIAGARQRRSRDPAVELQPTRQGIDDNAIHHGVGLGFGGKIGRAVAQHCHEGLGVTGLQVMPQCSDRVAPRQSSLGLAGVPA